MSFYQKYQKFSDSKFKRLTGIRKEQFVKLFELFADYKDKKWSKRGRRSNFILEDRLLLTLRYLRDYPTFIVIGNEFDISESFANKIFNKVSLALIKILKLPNLSALEVEFGQGKNLQKIIIDVSEQPTERPKKNKK